MWQFMQLACQAQLQWLPFGAIAALLTGCRSVRFSRGNVSAAALLNQRAVPAFRAAAHGASCYDEIDIHWYEIWKR
jgi:hypothetical protein